MAYWEIRDQEEGSTRIVGENLCAKEEWWTEHQELQIMEYCISW